MTCGLFVCIFDSEIILVKLYLQIMQLKKCCSYKRIAIKICFRWSVKQLMSDGQSM